ncbi:MAG TPA: hypothetical protein VGQ71_00050 [Terriglobales bacterium]|jgi:hypothetical protein|nr:hypothetical protein [Terriglobales bacterium]
MSFRSRHEAKREANRRVIDYVKRQAGMAVDLPTAVVKHPKAVQ